VRVFAETKAMSTLHVAFRGLRTGKRPRSSWGLETRKLESPHAKWMESAIATAFKMSPSFSITISIITNVILLFIF
jgi:hypothetical protein